MIKITVKANEAKDITLNVCLNPVPIRSMVKFVLNRSLQVKVAVFS